MKLYHDTNKELFLEQYKPLPVLDDMNIKDLYELIYNLLSAFDNSRAFGSDLLAVALYDDIITAKQHFFERFYRIRNDLKDKTRYDNIYTYDNIKAEGKQMKTYHIKPEYLDMWEGGDTPTNPDRIITEDELINLSEQWEKPIEELLKQLIPCE